MSENQVKANEQEIGYLRIVFGILLVADISFISWVFSSAGEVPERMAGVAGILALSGITFRCGPPNQAADRPNYEELKMDLFPALVLLGGVAILVLLGYTATRPFKK